MMWPAKYEPAWSMRTRARPGDNGRVETAALATAASLATPASPEAREKKLEGRCREKALSPDGAVTLLNA